MVCAALALGAAPLIQAEETTQPWSGQVTIASQYVSRGFQQSWGQPALQGGVDYTAPSGWFAGGWVSTVSPHFVEGGHLERDLYAGYAGQHGELNYRIGVYDYHYPGARFSATGTSYDYGELVFGVDWRNWSLAYSITVTRDYFGFNSQTLGVGTLSHSRGSGYLDLTRRFDLGADFGLSLHYGWQRVNHFSDYSWQDASVALTHKFAGLDLSVNYARGWNRAGVYRHYTTGVVAGDGRVHLSDPIAGTWFFNVSRAF
ncbi:MAG: TorF family putative porin [Rhodanobacter sp.]